MRDGEELGGIERDGHRENRRDGETDGSREGGGEEELGVDGGYCAEFLGALVGEGEEVVGGEQHHWEEGREGERRRGGEGKGKGGEGWEGRGEL